MTIDDIVQQLKKLSNELDHILESSLIKRSKNAEWDISEANAYIDSAIDELSRTALDLPLEEVMYIDSCLADAIEDPEAIEDWIDSYFDREYNVIPFDYDYKIENEQLHITEIRWELEDGKELLGRS